MTKFYVGQRIKKVRGRDDVGMTAVVTGGMTRNGARDGADILVIADGKAIDSETRVICPPGQLFHTWSDLWEPMTPPHEACDDAEFIALLDKLAQRVAEAA